MFAIAVAIVLAITIGSGVAMVYLAIRYAIVMIQIKRTKKDIAALTASYTHGSDTFTMAEYNETLAVFFEEMNDASGAVNAKLRN